MIHLQDVGELEILDFSRLFGLLLLLGLVKYEIVIIIIIIVALFTFRRLQGRDF